MEEPHAGSVTPLRSSLRRIVLLYGGLLLVSVSYQYLSGKFSSFPTLYFLWLSVSFQVLGMARAAAEALILDLAGRLRTSKSGRSSYRLLYIVPGLVQMVLTISDFGLPLAFILTTLEIALVFFGAALIWASYLDRYNASVNQTNAQAVQRHETDVTGDRIPMLLGLGNGYVDRVTRSVFGRSAKAERAASFSLGVMLTLVFVGGMASFGLWVFTHADRIATIENETHKLLALEAEMEGLRDNPDQELKDRVNRLLDFVKQNYKTTETLEATLNRLTVQSQTNLADIAVRVTIAVLTIFLVQVFFAVYKYNRHLGSVLAAKAEALELAANDEDARRELSHEAIAIVKESVPGFGPQPRTLYQQAVGVAEKFAKR